MLPVFWTEAADKDLAAITGYVAERDPLAALRLWQRLKNAAVNLSEHPYLFKESERMPGYREIVAHPNYLVFYRVLADRVQIEMVAHAKRLYPLQNKSQ
jgi:addiction module RelE/StbE family toxin